MLKGHRLEMPGVSLKSSPIWVCFLCGHIHFLNVTLSSVTLPKTWWLVTPQASRDLYPQC